MIVLGARLSTWRFLLSIDDCRGTTSSTSTDSLTEMLGQSQYTVQRFDLDETLHCNLSHGSISLVKPEYIQLISDPLVSTQASWGGWRQNTTPVQIRGFPSSPPQAL